MVSCLWIADLNVVTAILRTIPHPTVFKRYTNVVRSVLWLVESILKVDKVHLMKGSRVTLWAVGWWLCIFFAWTLVSAAEEELQKDSNPHPLRSGYKELIALRTGRSDHRIEKRSRSRNAMLRLGRAKSQDIYLRFGRGGGGGGDEREIYTDTRANDENSPFEDPRVPKAAQDMYLRLGRARLPDSFRHQQTYLRLGRAGDVGLLGSWTAEPGTEDVQPSEVDDELARLGQTKVF